ncbi:hypothetical protein [Xenophilus azovorans]|uniref:hypothetical protein n=1 Tax=Xenophilus azovorans TaxID=151755 RepID=UPI00056E94BF|nr:hypothetical protein [Xenophilus azovorans]
MRDDTDDWSLMLLPAPSARARRAQVPAAPAPAAEPQPAPHAAAWLDSARDRLDGLLNPGGKAAVPVKRFYRNGRADGYMQIVRRRG